ncbi:unnamed protein product [Eruca vesicaria subsp. sativa]|uniref:Serpin domain-containing protein n=1 Tax=Eruca vesicaria subsp. sativa TaxID=29727 RepID=A0ABC8J230_ERUVS|nr:unnamed protein product [Eruca vesicaria subsp. sativa]
MHLRDSVEKQNEYVLNFAKHVIATTDAKTSNLVFSPASINVVLSFLAAKSGGSTADHILSLLQASSTSDLDTVSSMIVTGILADRTASGGPTISVANGADEVVKEVNKWVKNQTRGQITNLLSSVPPETDLIFANALFFHGKWDKEFNPKLTKD